MLMYVVKVLSLNSRVIGRTLDMHTAYVRVCMGGVPDCVVPCLNAAIGWLRLVGSLKKQVSFAKEPYQRNDILQKRPIILRSLLIVATPYQGSACTTGKKIVEKK